MILGSGAAIGAAAFLVWLLFTVLLAVGLGQLLRAIVFEGWYKLLYPAQTVMMVSSSFLIAVSVWLSTPLMLASGIVGLLIWREDTDLRWFNVLSVLIIWALCLLSVWAI